MRAVLPSAIVVAVLSLNGRLLAQPIVIQAETFTCDGASWSVQDQATSYAADSGLKHLAGATGGQGGATRDLTVPADGHYFVWVRHSVMASGDGTNRGPFQVALKRDGVTTASARFDEQPPAEPPGYLHGYVWSKFEADLAAGALTIELTKLEPYDCSSWTRYVDLLVLTTDTQYVPKVTDFQPKTWLRVVLGPTQKTPIYIHGFADHYREPWYAHFCLSKEGFKEGIQPDGGTAAYLTAGEATPWCDITPVIHEDSGARLEIRGAEKYSYTEWLPSLDATLEFATAPDDAAIVKRFRREGPGAGLVVVVPGVLSDATAGELKSDQDFAAESAEFGKTLPSIPFGRRPREFPLFLSMSLNPALFHPDVRRAEYEVAAKLGFDGTSDGLDLLLSSLGFTMSHGGVGAWLMDNNCYFQPRMDSIKQAIADRVNEWTSPGKPTYLMLMDEPGGADLAHQAGCPRCAEVFRAWLRDELKVPLQDLGGASWDEVKPVAEADRETAPALYYWSQRLRAKALGDFLKIQTDEIERVWPGKPPTTVNFSDGATYQSSFFLQGTDYFEIIGNRDLTTGFSEDWSNIGSTYQACGYNLELLRAAAKYHNQPLGMYLITSFGRKPLDVKLKAYTDIGRGVKALNCYYYGPSYTNHETPWYMHKPMYEPVMELCREIGGAEDLLVQAKRVPSQVAFLYSRSSDIWTLNQTDLYGYERQHAYLALTHAQVPVDFLSEEDVAAGRLRPYKALYAFGPNLLRAAAQPIAEWVSAGGTLYLSAGSAVADEYNRPFDALDRQLGISRGPVEALQPFIGAGRNLSSLTVSGTVNLDVDSIDIVGVRQQLPLEPVPATIEYTADGAPVFRVDDVGKGTVFMSGCMPGLSYIRKALLARENQEATDKDKPADLPLDMASSFRKLTPTQLSYNPWEYPDAEREWLLAPVRRAHVEKPVLLDRRVVESFYLEAPSGAVVTLANYTLKPIESLQVTVRAPKPVKRIESVRQGRLPFSKQGLAVTVRVPLRDTDFLKLYW